MNQFAISSMTSTTMILNWVSREVTKKITDKAGNQMRSTIHPTGFDLPIDIVEKIFWDYFLPEWRSQQCLPNDFRQDICLLARTSYPPQLRRHRSRSKEVILTLPLPVGTAEGVYGDWVYHSHGFHFETSVDSRDPEEVYGEEHKKIFQKLMDQANWSKVEILNHIRSIECPVLMDNSSPTFEDDCDRVRESYEFPDSMELRELTEEDFHNRAIGTYEETKAQDQIILEETFDQIIRNNLKIESGGCGAWSGTSNGIIWHPGLNCPGTVTFTTR